MFSIECVSFRLTGAAVADRDSVFLLAYFILFFYFFYTIFENEKRAADWYMKDLLEFFFY